MLIFESLFFQFIFVACSALYRDELMPLKTAIVGYARSKISVDELRANINRYIKLKDEDETMLFEEFLQHNVYVQGNYDRPEDFQRLMKTVDLLEHSGDEQSKINNRLFYLALPPTVFEPVTSLIHKFCMSKTYCWLFFCWQIVDSFF